MIKRVVVVAGLIRAPHHHLQFGKILMSRRLAGVHLAGSWEFPGGKIELGEDPQEALHRELEEELGIQVNHLKIYAVGHHLYQGEGESRSKDVILIIYDCELISGEPQALEVAEFAWLTPQEVCALELPPADEEVILRLRTEIGAQ